MKASIEKFIIETRYEYRSINGIIFTKWFVFNSIPYTEEESKNKIKEAKEHVKSIEKATKLKHEFRLKSYNEYSQEQKDIIKENKKLAKEQEKYYKSKEYKELQKLKRQSAKELKAKQEEYKKKMEES